MPEEVKLRRPPASAWAQETLAKFSVTFSPHSAELRTSVSSFFRFSFFLPFLDDDFFLEKSHRLIMRPPGGSLMSRPHLVPVIAAFHLVK